MQRHKPESMRKSRAEVALKLRGSPKVEALIFESSAVTCYDTTVDQRLRNSRATANSSCSDASVTGLS